MKEADKYLIKYHNNNQEDWLFKKRHVVAQLMEEYASQSKPEEITSLEDANKNLRERHSIALDTIEELKEEIAGHEKMRKRAAEVVVDLSNKLSKSKEELEQIKPEEIDVKNAMLHVFDNFNNNLSRNEVEKRIDDYLADQTRLKPVDTKTVDAIDPTFWRRLEMFVSNIQVNDMAGEEEKQYIIHVIESKK